MRPVLFILVVFLNLITCMPAFADGAGKVNVLFIFSWHKDMPWQVEVEKGFADSARDYASKPNVFYEYMDAGRFSSQKLGSVFKEYLTEKYAGHDIDYVIYESGAAARLFKSFPELFQASKKIVVNPGPVLESIPSSDTSTILPVNVDYERAAQEILAANKGKTIYLVTGARGLSRERVKKNAEIIANLDPDKKVVPFVGLPMHELLEKVSKLGPNSVIYYLLILQDGEGKRYIPYDAAEQICQKASVPVYSLWTSLMGSGILGGYLLSGEKVGRELASILENPDNFQKNDPKSLSDRFHGFYFDWRELQRWDINEASLPSGSMVLFKKQSFYDQYYREIIFGSVVIILVISFFWNLRLKKEVTERLAVEQMLRESENKFRSLSDATFEGIMLLDNGIIVEANSTFTEMFGYSSPSELIGINAIEIISPEDRVAIQQKIISGDEKIYETKGYKKDSTSFPIEIRGKTLLYNQQQVRVTAIRDLTEIKKSEEEIKALKGIIPICMHCKGIRDDKGYWNDVEKYIAKHSDAQFSHGICEKCLEKHYGKSQK